MRLEQSKCSSLWADIAIRLRAVYFRGRRSVRSLNQPLMRTLVLSFLAASAAAAQTPTDPASMWISCWGYNVSDGRQYNCVGSVTRTSEAQRFFPDEGASCAGSVKMFSLGRKGVQITCSDSGDPDPPPRPGGHISVENARRYQALFDLADWLYFDVRIVRGVQFFRLGVTFHHTDGSRSECREYQPLEPGPCTMTRW